MFTIMGLSEISPDFSHILEEQQRLELEKVLTFLLVNLHHEGMFELQGKQIRMAAGFPFFHYLPF